MLFHDYLEKLLGSKSKVKVLRALYRFPGKDFTSREISRLIGISHTGVLKALKDLEEMNIVEVRTHGRAHLLRLNEKSFLAEKILAIFEIEKATISNLIEELRKSTADIDALSIVLFGSIAKKGGEPRSDIDLLVISGDKESAEKKFSGIQKRFIELFGNPISPHIIGPEEFRKSKKFAEDVLGHGILIRGKKLEELYAHSERRQVSIQELPHESG